MTLRARAAGMEPVPIGIECILDGIIADSDIVVSGERTRRVFPGIAFVFEQVDIALVIVVMEQGMSHFVQDKSITIGARRVIKEFLRFAGPTKPAAWLKSEL